MIQRVPNLDPEGTAKLGLQVDTDHNSPSLDVPMLDYELGELIWENGQLAVHGLGQPRVVGKSMPKYVWNKPRASDTLDSVVNQATRVLCKSPYVDSDDLVPCFQNHTHAAASAGTMDAMVPCTYPTQKSANSANEHDVGKCPTVPDPSFNLEVGFSTRVDSCSGPLPGLDPSCCPLVDELAEATEKRKWAEHVLQLQPTREERVAHDISSRKQSVSVSATFGRKSKRMTLDTCERNLDVGFTSTSLCSAKPTSSFTKPTTVDDHDSVFHGKPQREASGDDERIGKAGPSSVSTQRSRAAAIHNQSERKRRDKINQRIKTLQKLVPNASKTDKASMLDEIIDYVKQLQAQVQLISRMNMAQMVIPMSMQQLQMSMMAQMGLGMGMGMMNMNSNIGRPSPTGIPPIIQPAFFPMAPSSWDASGERLPASGTVLPDPFSTFLAFQKQPMNVDGYNGMAALFHHLHQPQHNNSTVHGD